MNVLFSNRLIDSLIRSDRSKEQLFLIHQIHIDFFLMESTSYVERPSFRPAQFSYPSGPMHWAHLMDGGNKI
ncbi:hypothetical protein RIF29_43335 [Crotalaria pallida]|uniref:Uncharacterized protein n=1 Tax=Crotalaria pallida TaxID=3830 RepID=A0AAN9DZ72_CROPI